MISQLIALCACVTYIQAAGWNYDLQSDYGPNKWASIYASCQGSRQSPVDIKDGDVQHDTDLENFSFSNYDTSSNLDMTMSNNGHSVKVALSGDTEVTLSGGSLGDTFQAVQFHFHWGSSSAQGSEHLFNNHAYPMELHIVHVNTKYENISVAVGKPDGLAVLGFMYQIADNDNANYTDIVSKLASIQAVNQKEQLTSVAMETLLPPSYKTSNYYRYLGGLTTPTCNEAVIWTVMTDVITISETQMAEFRKVLDSMSKPIVDNYRPVQPLKGRMVKANYQPELHWGYATDVVPAKWQDYYGSCGGQSQSPIDIPKFDASTKDDVSPWVMTNYDTTAGVTMELSNNGHTAKIGISGGDMTVSGGDLPEDFKVLQLHFHWGASGDMGSEHLVQGKAYPMELHIVHYRGSWNVSHAVKTKEGLAVLGFFFEESEDDNPNYASIVQALADIKNGGDKVSITAMRLDSLIPGASELKHFYRYSGSLTTPGCFESVIWTVFVKTVPISRAQLEAFRGLKSAEKDEQDIHLQLVNNYRPPQPLNDRAVTVAVPKWSYFGHHGPAAEQWGDYYAYCKDHSGSRQSPINIDPTTVSLDSSLKDFSFINWDTPQPFTLKNTGHSLNMNLKSSGVTTSGGGLGDTYELAQFHFHWGANSLRGSEHLIDNTAYPMEVHFVHFNMKYSTIGNALKKSDGLAVLGFMFKISDEDNPAMEPIVSKLAQVVDKYSEFDIGTFVANSILPSGLSEYYRYLGSLTTPGCFESVTWTVFREYITISEKQMQEFRKLMSSEKDASNKYMPMVDNYRPVMNINKREIKATFLIGAGSVASHCVVTMMICLLAVLIHRFV